MNNIVNKYISNKYFDKFFYQTELSCFINSGVILSSLQKAQSFFAIHIRSGQSLVYLYTVQHLFHFKCQIKRETIKLINL